MTKREFLDIVFALAPNEANAIMDAFDEYVDSNEPHWIPVTEDTLPERNRVVVVCGEKGTWDFGTYRGHGNDIHYWNWKKNTYKRVYWWMYKENALPEPYKPTVPPECEGDCGWCKPSVIEKCKGVTT